MFPNSNTTKIAKLILKEIKDLSLDKIDLEKYCYEKLKKHFPKLSEFQLTDENQVLLKKTKFYINKWIEECKKEGIIPAYEFNEFPEYLLIRYSIKYKEGSRISELRKQKKALIQAINKISWQKFEYLCKYILEQKGIHPIQLTTKSQEGIDFCGLFNMGNYLTSGLIPANFKIRVIGQVKHFSSKISPTLIRSFHTYYLSVQRGDQNVVRKLPNWFVSTKSPILSIFMTTSSYTRRAINYAEQEWIILKTGEQIAEDLIKSSDTNKWFLENSYGKFAFSRKGFQDFFSKAKK
jgi:hypothetical protein